MKKFFSSLIILAVLLPACSVSVKTTDQTFPQVIAETTITVEPQSLSEKLVGVWKWTQGDVEQVVTYINFTSGARVLFSAYDVGFQSTYNTPSENSLIIDHGTNDQNFYEVANIEADTIILKEGEYSSRLDRLSGEIPDLSILLLGDWERGSYQFRFFNNGTSIIYTDNQDYFQTNYIVKGNFVGIDGSDLLFLSATSNEITLLNDYYSESGSPITFTRITPAILHSEDLIGIWEPDSSGPDITGKIEFTKDGKFISYYSGSVLQYEIISPTCIHLYSQENMDEEGYLIVAKLSSQEFEAKALNSNQVLRFSKKN